LFCVGLVCLIKGGDWFVDGATGISHRLHIPELLIGATVVSIGTTLPEVMVSATSAVSGHGEIAYGNALGSVICNTALISAITITFSPAAVARKTFITPVIFFFLAACFYSVVAYTTGYFYRWTGIVLLCLFVVYMVLTVVQAKKAKSDTALANGEGEAAAETSEADEETKGGMFKDIILLIIGAALIAVGARLLVDNGTKIAAAMGVPESVIALTFVALGTSLPELVTAVSALIKKHSDLSLGNIVGANLFNIVLVSGLSTTLNPFAIPGEKTLAGINSSLVVDIPVMLFVMLFMTVPALISGKLKRYQGIILLAVYAAFTAFQFVM